jgi:hypothetical protein
VDWVHTVALANSPLAEAGTAAAFNPAAAAIETGSAAAADDAAEEPAGEANARPALRASRSSSEKDSDGGACGGACGGADLGLALAEAAAVGNRIAASHSCAGYVASLTSCQLCLEVTVAPVGFVGCGHPVCRPCFDRIQQVAAARAASTGAAADAVAAVAAAGRADSAVSRCPTCRALAGGYVELVQLKRLASELQAQAYARQKLELRDLNYAQHVAAALAAARSLFPSHASPRAPNGPTFAAAGPHAPAAAAAPRRHLLRRSSSASACNRWEGSALPLRRCLVEFIALCELFFCYISII